MSTQYKDGSFSETLKFKDALEYFQQEMETNHESVKALHVGTFDEIEEVKTEFEKVKKVDNMQTQIDELTKRLDSMEVPKSDIIYTLDKDQVAEFIAKSINN